MVCFILCSEYQFKGLCLSDQFLVAPRGKEKRGTIFHQIHRGSRRARHGADPTAIEPHSVLFPKFSNSQSPLDMNRKKQGRYSLWDRKSFYF